MLDLNLRGSSLIYNSDDAKMGQYINLILLNKGDVK